MYMYYAFQSRNQELLYLFTFESKSKKNSNQFKSSRNHFAFDSIKFEVTKIESKSNRIE